ncbi:MAG: hypothetical protein HY922_00365 [Elusimicrobia bacterium]|nr:hypothetical protein [Elusimicrobiota bacterium]
MNALLVALLWAAPAAAQMELGTSVAPDFFAERKAAAVGRSTAAPLALALSLSFDAATWARIGVSTSAPAADLANYVSHGCYKLELIELISIAASAGKPLALLAARREKRESLRKIAQSYSLDYDALLEVALQDERLVTLRLEGLGRVAPLGPSGGKP